MGLNVNIWYMKKATIVFIAFFLQVLAYTQSSHKKIIHVLIIDGYSNHDWKQTTKLTKGILEESKLFTVDISTAPATTNEDSLANWNPEFKGYDVIIQNTNNIAMDHPIHGIVYQCERACHQFNSIILCI